MRLPGWLRLAATAAVVAALVTHVDEQTMLEALHRADWVPAAAALALVVPNFLAAGWAWFVIARRIAPDATYGECLRAVIGSHALGFWTPARIGEFAGRGWMHGRGNGWAWASGVGLEAFLRYGPPFLLGSSCVLLLAPEPVLAWRAVAGVSLVLFAAVLALALRPARLHAWFVRSRPRPGLDFLLAMRPSDGAAAMAANGLRMTIGASQLSLMALAFGASVSFPWLVVASLATLSVKNVIPNLTLGDLGIREAAAAFFLAGLGVDPALGVDAALGLYTVNILVPAALGAVMLSRMPTHGG